MTDLIRKDSLLELIGHRDRAIAMYLQGYRTMIAGVEAHKRACVGLSHITGLHWEALRFVHMDTRQRDENEFMTKQRRELDRDMWRALLVNTTLGSLMDNEERDRFYKGLENPPEITVETVLATFQRLAGDARAIFRRGLVNTFRHLSPEHHSNDGFTMGKRMVIKRIVTCTPIDRGRGLWVRTDSYGEQTLRDVDRALHVLSGLPPPEPMQGVVQAVYEAIKADQWEAETDLVRVRWFKNGNGHLWVKSDDLLCDLNLEIAAHYGAALGTADRARRRNAA